MCTSASVVFLFQNVYSKWTLLLSSCESNPASNSDERSGLRFGVARLARRESRLIDFRASPLRPVSATVAGAYVIKPCVAPGCTPLAPYALAGGTGSASRRFGKNALVGHDPREADLRVVHLLEVRAERTVLVRADGAGEEEAVVNASLLLHVHAERLDRGRLLLRSRCASPPRRRSTRPAEASCRSCWQSRSRRSCSRRRRSS